MKKKIIAIIGLGYVGLPLAMELSKKNKVIGFDTNLDRIKSLELGLDTTLEVNSSALLTSENLFLTNNSDDIKKASIYIVTVPTPINKGNQPDLTPLLSASKTVGKNLDVDDMVIYESTVYPGATEEECVPVLEHYSNLSFNNDFFVGYSPERINPGDTEHNVTNIVKVTSGSTPESADEIDELYNSIVSVGTFKASSIKVAEAAKVIENTQRDVNIALINELAIIFNILNIDTEEVLKAAGTKWNFLPFRPGLVGGHCIGVDPYYLTYKAESLGYHPQIILAGRRLNDDMSSYITNRLIKDMLKKNIIINQSKILIMGLSFKENCPDIRNTKVVNIVSELQDFDLDVDVYDPWVDPAVAKKEFNITMTDKLVKNTYDAVLIAVAHDQFREMGLEKIYAKCKPLNIVFDLKYMFPSHKTDARL